MPPESSQVQWMGNSVIYPTKTYYALISSIVLSADKGRIW